MLGLKYRFLCGSQELLTTYGGDETFGQEVELSEKYVWNPMDREVGGLSMDGSNHLVTKQ